MSDNIKHICVCICTYKRPQLLKRLLAELAAQDSGGLFTYSIVVADNDASRSAESVVDTFRGSVALPVRYCVEPRQGIGLARNTAIANADGDFIAFIDDDEFPEREWLLALFKTCNQYQVQGVLGPVKRHFDEKPPDWLAKSRFYKRRTHRTGTLVDKSEARTGNVLLKKEILSAGEPPFSPELHRGEDKDFFVRMIGLGHVFIWCDEAVVFETVPPARWSRTFILKRALMRASINAGYSTFGIRKIAKSLIAVPLYTLALPFALMLGQHRFMGLLERLVAHLGELLTLVGMNPVKSPFATD